MKKLTIFLIAVFIWLVAYVYIADNQISDVKEVCSIFHKGTTVEDFNGIEDRYSVRQMLSFNKNKIEKQTVVFCATFTMCDCLCELEILNHKVIKARVVWY